ncbi:monovalent cation:proton antiporter-2 (CPA2) family protein [Mesorhizobium muleiense]|uniref:monovalent cation:proton antiporter-2 (CPA2) family protein n=1 Tax=Mesorhizobium muleiense TaxID=1004279 RepID=UPI003AFAF005
MPESVPHDYSILRDAVVFLMASILVVPLVRRLGIDAVNGYLISGLVIGPYGFGLVSEVEGTHRLAELGIVFMLFAIGLELSFDRLRTMALYVFGLGVAQVAITGAVIGAGVLAFGGTIGQAAIIGGALALSSTACVLRLLSERGELSSHLGRVVLSVLLLQDLTLVPGLAVVTALGQEPEELAWTLAEAGLKATVALVILLAAGRLLLRPLYRVIAGTGNAELFIAATLLVVLGTAWGTALAGLPMALGAFLAGLMLAGTEYRHQIEADIRPVRGVLLGLFFISIGMLVDVGVVLPQLHWILLVAVALMAVKALLILGLCTAFGLPLPLAASAGLHLAQGGELAFVLFSLAMGTEALSVETGQFLLAVVAVSMATTPFLARAGRATQSQLERRGLPSRTQLQAETGAYSGHVVIAGFGRVGQVIGKLLDERGYRWVAVDLDAKNVERSRKERLPVFFGDASQEEMVAAARIDSAKAMVVTLDDPEAAKSVLAALRRKLPDLPVVVRARHHVHVQELLEKGATTVMPEMTESSLLLGAAVLQELGDSKTDVDAAVRTVRAAQSNEER